MVLYIVVTGLSPLIKKKNHQCPVSLKTNATIHIFILTFSRMQGPYTLPHRVLEVPTWCTKNFWYYYFKTVASYSTMGIFQRIFNAQLDQTELLVQVNFLILLLLLPNLQVKSISICYLKWTFQRQPCTQVPVTHCNIKE